MKQFYPSLVIICFLLFFYAPHASAQQDTLKTGSFIINMGVTPQTIANGLKPYGLVYDLVKNYKVPVKWIINTGKTKDGIDFTHNGISYRGGTFIVPFEFRTPAVNSVISSWETQGVIGNTSVSQMILDTFKTIYYAPNWTLDYQNGALAATYFTNAGIPASAHGGPSNWKIPADLNACDDIFVLPHADPTWDTHKNLYYWNRDHKGNIWAACHAVSVLESITDPADTIQLNFLSTTGLVNWTLHKKDASPPYQYQDHGNPIMQFMGILDDATNIGSEKTYIPLAGGAWRSTTTLGVYDTTHKDIPSLSDGPAAIVAYGRAYGDDSRGYVMYEAGHDHNTNGTVAEQVAAQRAFLNYSLLVAVDRYADFDAAISGLPDVPVSNQPYQLSFAVPSGIDLNNYTIEWSSSCGGTFSNTNTQTVTYTPPVTSSACIVTVTLTDGCGRQLFASEGAYITTVLSASAATLRGSHKVMGDNAIPQIRLLSNPVKGNIVFEYESSASGNINAMLFDMNGRVIKQQNISVQKGVNKIQMNNYSAWPAGMYILRVVTAGKSITQKIQIIK